MKIIIIIIITRIITRIITIKIVKFLPAIMKIPKVKLILMIRKSGIIKVRKINMVLLFYRVFYVLFLER